MANASAPDRITINQRTSVCFLTWMSCERMKVHATSLTIRGRRVCDTESSTDPMTTSSEPTGSSPAPSPVLIAIPRLQGEQKNQGGLHAVRSAAPRFDVLVVDDGSKDA